MAVSSALRVSLGIACGFLSVRGGRTGDWRTVTEHKQQQQQQQQQQHKQQDAWSHGEDTFSAQDDRSDEQMATGQRVLLSPSTAASIHSIAKQEPRTAGNEPSCASSSAAAFGGRVVSMADLHGDFDAMVSHLYKLGLLTRMPGRSESAWQDLWGGGDTTFVQCGDILDRGPDGRLMYKFLWALQDSAPQGQVVLLTGNHELMVLQGDVRYVTNIDFCMYTGDNCGGSPPASARYCSTCCTYTNKLCQTDPSQCLEGNCEFLEAWDINGEMGAELRRRFVDGKMKLAHMINGVLFTHAGLVSSIWPKIGHSSGEEGIEKLNNRTIQLFSSSNGEALRNSDDVIAESGGQGGPMWTRVCYDDWYTRPGRRRRSGGHYYMDDDEKRRVEPGRCETLTKSLRDVSATRMVIGHCPRGPSSGSDGVETSCTGSLVMSDTYMSIAYAGTRGNADYNMAALEFYAGDPEQRVWAVYSGRNSCTQLPAGLPPASPESAALRVRARFLVAWAVLAAAAANLNNF